MTQSQELKCKFKPVPTVSAHSAHAPTIIGPLVGDLTPPFISTISPIHIAKSTIKETAMLSQALSDRLNKQINLEMYSSHLYLQMSSWCAYQSLDGCEEFLRLHAEEEAGHMHRLLSYMHETGGFVVLGGMEAPPTQFDSLQDLFEKIFEHEQLVTRSINDLVHLGQYRTRLRHPAVFAVVRGRAAPGRVFVQRHSRQNQVDWAERPGTVLN
jgi:hypothetical protein